MPAMRDITEPVAAEIARHGYLAAGERVTCLVSGGADSTCLWHVLTRLGYDVRAVHVHHGVRGAPRIAMPRTASRPRRRGRSSHRWAHRGRASDGRYAATAATGSARPGHTASDQVETVLLRLLASGSTRGIRPVRDDGVVRPLLTVWREETQAYCAEHGLAFVEDETNPTQARAARSRLPLLEELDPRSRRAYTPSGRSGPPPPAARGDAGGAASDPRGRGTGRSGWRAPRRPGYDELRLEGTVSWGPWRLS